MTAGHPAFAAELRVARDAAAEAAKLLSGRSGADQVREKERADLVTEVDEAAERLIVRRIREHFPDDVVVAEEFSPGASAFPGDARLAGRSWIIDPVDGTTNYVHGHPYACVSIAFLDPEGLAVGVVHAPFLREVYHAVRGGGAFLNDRAITVSRTADGSAGLYGTGFPFKSGKGEVETYFQLVADVMLGAHDVRRAGSAALDLAYVAAGRLDGFFEIGLAPWDIAAGLLLITEAGGTIGGWPGDRDPPLGTGRLLCSNGKVHGWLEEKVGRYAGKL